MSEKKVDSSLLASIALLEHEANGIPVASVLVAEETYCPECKLKTPNVKPKMLVRSYSSGGVSLKIKQCPVCRHTDREGKITKKPPRKLRGFSPGR